MTRDETALRDRARGCLLGLADGDALGGPLEGWLELLEPGRQLWALADVLVSGSWESR